MLSHKALYLDHPFPLVHNCLILVAPSPSLLNVQNLTSIPPPSHHYLGGGTILKKGGIGKRGGGWLKRGDNTPFWTMYWKANHQSHIDKLKDLVCWTADSLFLEEISECAAVHMHYVMDTCDDVWSIILLFHIVGCHSCLSHEEGWMSVNLKTEKPNHIEQALTSYFWGKKEPNTLVFLSNHVINSFFFVV